MSSNCIYCGSSINITREHIPPQSYFPDPKPKDLITVPSCSDCNKSFQKDEAYFRASFLFTEAGTKPNGKLLWEQKLNRMYEKDKGIRNKIAQGLAYRDTFTPSGIYLGKRMTLRIEQERFLKVAEKVLRGLYYFEYGEMINATTEVQVLWLSTEENFKAAEVHINDLPFADRQWPGIFEYRRNKVDGPNQGSMWLMRFFGYACFWCITSEIPRNEMVNT